jgi:hypothetical protein
LTKNSGICSDAHFTLSKSVAIHNLILSTSTERLEFGEKKCNTDAGNWCYDNRRSDLSCRAQLKKKFKYLEHVVTPAELPGKIIMPLARNNFVGTKVV